MTLWWIGNAVLLVVAVVVFVLLQNLLKPVKKIQSAAGEIIQHAGGLSTNLTAVPKLLQTQRLVTVARQGVGAYGEAITKLL